MKKLLKFIGLSVVIVCFSATVFGQGVSATANASAVIITPIAITKTTDLSFGNLAVGAGGGTLILSTASGRTATGDVSYQAAPAATAAPVFKAVLLDSFAIITVLLVKIMFLNLSFS